MVRLEALLPILLEDDDDHTASRSDLIGVQPLIDELADHGITTDAELLFLSPSENISIEAARTLEVLDIRNKIANFLAAEGSTADDIYRDEEAQISTSGSSMPDDLCNTGIEAVDKLLGGGWSGEVVELLGEKGVGKTWVRLLIYLLAQQAYI